jgi:hypothetical protein
MTERVTNADRTGRLHESVDRDAARGIPGSAVAADGREHIRGVPCPGPHMYLTADRHLWCPDMRLDQRKVGKLLTRAFPPKKYR